MVPSRPYFHVPVYTEVYGPASSFSLYSYFMGIGKLDIWAGGTGANICPFSDVSFCQTLSQLREITKRLVSPRVLHLYQQMSSAYAIWLPQNQVMSSFCGDPIAYDKFQHNCMAQSYCATIITVLPNMKMGIRFTVNPLHSMFAVVYLGSTALAKNFIHDYVPHRVLQLPFMNHMAVWFPAFSISGSEKGGQGFFKPCAHPLMDYMTYLLLRLLTADLEARETALALFMGKDPGCEFKKYTLIDDVSSSQAAFQQNQNEEVFDPSLGIPKTWKDASIPYSPSPTESGSKLDKLLADAREPVTQAIKKAAER